MDAFLENGAGYLGSVLDSMLYGLHAALFLLYLHAKRTKSYNRIFDTVALLLFVLCTFVVVVDVWSEYIVSTNQESDEVQRLSYAYSGLYAVIDFVAQMTLIFRCWIIWNRRYIVLFFPALISLATLGCELALIGIPIVQKETINFSVLLDLGRFAFSGSLVVNAFVTIMITARIWVLSRRFACTNQKADKAYTIIIATLLESGMATFIAQLLWLILFSINSPGFQLVAGAVTQIYGITPTILIMRVTSGLSYDAETKITTPESMVFAKSAKSQAAISLVNPNDRGSEEHTKVYDVREASDVKGA